MSYVTCLRGIGSGACYTPARLSTVCRVDGRPLEMVLDLERLRRDHPDGGWRIPQRTDMWRYGALLALDPRDAEDRRYIVSLGEGATPLLDWSDHPLASRARLRLLLKEEGRAVPGYGRNPTGSFKDRGMAMVASMARRHGVTRLAIPTQGNAGDSLVEYAVHAGLEVVVVLPRDTPGAIRERVESRARTHPGVRCELVDGTIREAGAVVRERYVPQGWFSVATFQEPGWRIEGKKTLGLEIAEQPDGRWRLPDAIVYPTGGGTGVLGMWKAFAELEALGLIDGRRPRMISVQSAATAPLVAAFARGDADTTPVSAGRTLAVGLNVPGGIGHFRVLEILRESGGTAVAVEEDEIAAAWRDARRDKGWTLSPEGAATLAALPRLLESGHVRAGDHVVAVNTGAWEKYLPDARRLEHGIADPPAC
jgi:threonine synthase